MAIPLFTIIATSGITLAIRNKLAKMRQDGALQELDDALQVVLQKTDLNPEAEPECNHKQPYARDLEKENKYLQRVVDTKNEDLEKLSASYRAACEMVATKSNRVLELNEEVSNIHQRLQETVQELKSLKQDELENIKDELTERSTWVSMEDITDRFSDATEPELDHSEENPYNGKEFRGDGLTDLPQLADAIAEYDAAQAEQPEERYVPAAKAINTLVEELRTLPEQSSLQGRIAHRVERERLKRMAREAINGLSQAEKDALNGQFS